jgi:uncharacterized membrane protein YccC
MKEATVGLLDKAKEIAGQGAEAAKKAAEAAKDKAGDLQAKRRADDLAEQLGYLVVRQRTEGADVTAESQRLVDEIVELQREIAEGAVGADAAGSEGAETVGE